MDIFELLQRGYFPKELPLPFNTYKFALIADKLISKISGIPKLEKDSVPATYTIEKSNVSRRTIHIPNPLHYLLLSDLIVKNQTLILKHFPKSLFSTSKVEFESNILRRSIAPKGYSINLLDREKLKVAVSKRFEVKLDVDNYYPSVYTHSIAWALVGRDKAKKLYSNKSYRKSHTSDLEVTLYELGDKIDTAIRNCNEKQTHGILIGPDVSFLVGELIMSRIDANLSEKYSNIKGFRYYDDYTFYVDKEEDADRLYQNIQTELRSFGLEINESKYEKRKFPFPIHENFRRELNAARISKERTNKDTAILEFFDLMWKCAELNSAKTTTIFKYGLTTLIKRCVKIDADNKAIYEPLLYKTALIKPSVIPLICKIFTLSREEPTMDLLTETINMIIKTHVPYAQENEVAWALWVCKKYSIKLEKEEVLSIIRMGSTICAIILLDILHSHMSALRSDKDVQSCIDTLSSSWKKESLYTEDWLLLYETSEHGWIDNSKLINNDPFFKLLHDEGVKFYDENIKADYTSYDYIETLPFDFYPKHIKDEADAIESDILKTVKKTVFDRLYDEAVFSEDGINDFIQSQIEVFDIENDLFGRVVHCVFRGIEIEKDKLIDEFVNIILTGLEY